MGVVSGNTLTVTVVGIGVAIHTSCQGAPGQPGQPSFAPGGSLAVVGSGAAHGIVADGSAAEAGQPVIGVTEGGRYRRTGGGGAQSKGVSLDGGQVTNTIILINIGFCKCFVAFPDQLVILVIVIGNGDESLPGRFSFLPFPAPMS